MKPYQERFINEYVELYDKRQKLSHIIDQATSGRLDFELNCDIGLLMVQCAVMDSYLLILKMRAQQEHLLIELEEAMYKFFKSKGGSLYGKICETENQDF